MRANSVIPTEAKRSEGTCVSAFAVAFLAVIVAGDLLFCAPNILAQTAPADVPTPDTTTAVTKHVTPHITGVSLQNLDSDKAVISVGLEVTSDKDLDLSEMKVTRLRLNGLPVFASPIDGPIHLAANQTWVAPTPLAVTIYLRDMASMEPLMTAVSTGKLNVDGEVIVHVQLSKMQKMMTFSSQATVPVKIHQEVELEVPGGAFGRGAAGLVLTGVNATMEHLKVPVQGVLGGLRAVAKERDLPRIATVLTTFNLVDPTGKTTAVAWTGTAFFVDPHQLVTVAEALQPWAFDPDIELAVRSKEFKVDESSLHVVVTPASGPALELGKDLTVGSGSNQKKEQYMMPKDGSVMPVKAQIAMREEPQNLILLNVSTPAGTLAPVVEAKLTDGQSWDQVAVFRPARADSGHAGEIEILLLPAAYQDGRIKLRSMVDSDVFGSPIVSPDGLIGVVQDEATAVAWPDAMKSLKLKPSAVETP